MRRRVPAASSPCCIMFVEFAPPVFRCGVADGGCLAFDSSYNINTIPRWRLSASRKTSSHLGTHLRFERKRAPPQQEVRWVGQNTLSGRGGKTLSVAVRMGAWVRTCVHDFCSVFDFIHSWPLNHSHILHLNISVRSSFQSTHGLVVEMFSFATRPSVHEANGPTLNCVWWSNDD